MKLEVGRTYKTRNGDKVTLGPTAVEGCVGFGDNYGLYLPDGKFGYMEDGRHVCQCTSLDIIAEWTDEPQSKLYNSLTDEQKEVALHGPVETGTLQELNVKPGDVVEAEWQGDGDWRLFKLVKAHPKHGFECLLSCDDGIGYIRMFDVHQWKFRRASTTPSPVRTVTRITTHGTWSPRGKIPKTQYVYEIEFDLDENGHPDWKTATVRGK